MNYCSFYIKYTELTQQLEHLRLAGVKSNDLRVTESTLVLNKLFVNATDLDLFQFSQSPDAFRGIYPKMNEEARAKKIFELVEKMRLFHSENV